MAFDNDGEIEQLTATTGEDGAQEQGGDGATAVAHCAGEDGNAREKRQRNGTGAETEPGDAGAAESKSDSGARHDEGDTQARVFIPTTCVRQPKHYRPPSVWRGGSAPLSR